MSIFTKLIITINDLLNLIITLTDIIELPMVFLLLLFEIFKIIQKIKSIYRINSDRNAKHKEF